MNLVTAETFHANPADHGHGEVPAAAWSLIWHSSHFKDAHAHDLPTKTDGRIKAYAFVSAGRWSVQCSWCPSAEYAAFTDRRFMCSACLNAQSMQWIKVVWPTSDMIQEVDQVLSLRPEPKTRGWVVGETVMDLILENEENGIRTFAFMNVQDPGHTLSELKLQRMYEQATALQPKTTKRKAKRS